MTPQGIANYRTPPESWRQRQTKIRHAWSLPFQWIEWVFEWVVYGFSRWAFLEFLDYAARFSLLVAVISYFGGAEARRKAKHYEAWQVINSAHAKGGSGGRIEALQDLHRDRVSLAGVDVAGAWLVRIQLPSADLVEAHLDSALLDLANFSKANLHEAWLFRASLKEATFDSANLYKANLYHAQLTKSSMKMVTLRGASLPQAELINVALDSADLRGADLGGVNMDFARLRGANLEGADLRNSSLLFADLRQSNLSTIANWRNIRYLAGANVAEVRNAPDGFIPWAVDSMGAVIMADDHLWKKFRNQAATGSVRIRLTMERPGVTYTIGPNCDVMEKLLPFGSYGARRHAGVECFAGGTTIPEHLRVPGDTIADFPAH